MPTCGSPAAHAASWSAYPAACAAASRRFCKFIRRQSRGCPQPHPGPAGASGYAGVPRIGKPSPNLANVRDGGGARWATRIHAWKPRPQLRPFAYRCSGGTRRRKRRGTPPGIHAENVGFPTFTQCVLPSFSSGFHLAFFETLATTRFSSGLHQVSTGCYQVFTRSCQG